MSSAEVDVPEALAESIQRIKNEHDESDIDLIKWLENKRGDKNMQAASSWIRTADGGAINLARVETAEPSPFAPGLVVLTTTSGICENVTAEAFEVATGIMVARRD